MRTSSRASLWRSCGDRARLGANQDAESLHAGRVQGRRAPRQSAGIRKEDRYQSGRRFRTAGELYKKQLLSLSTGARHDVYFMDEPWVPALADFLLPLDDRVKDIDMPDFIPTTVEAGAYGGKQYALPVDPNVQILIYRKDLFEKKGLKPPTTWTTCSGRPRPCTIRPSNSTALPSRRDRSSGAALPDPASLVVRSGVGD